MQNPCFPLRFEISALSLGLSLSLTVFLFATSLKYTWKKAYTVAGLSGPKVTVKVERAKSSMSTLSCEKKTLLCPFTVPLCQKERLCAKHNVSVSNIEVSWPAFTFLKNILHSLLALYNLMWNCVFNIPHSLNTAKWNVFKDDCVLLHMESTLCSCFLSVCCCRVCDDFN